MMTMYAAVVRHIPTPVIHDNITLLYFGKGEKKHKAYFLNIDKIHYDFRTNMIIAL